MTAVRIIRIATRASRLALWQAEHVAALLRSAAPEYPVELIPLSTIGDRDLESPLRQMGSLGVFTREVQLALLEKHADIAVHSLKDLPTEPVEGLCLGGVPARGPVADAFVLPKVEGQTASAAADFAALPQGARVGTGSLRRQAQLRHLRPDLQLSEIRGNVETRLKKLDSGEYEALILAVAGLERLELGHRISQKLGPPILYPAVGQGALGLECRAEDELVKEVLTRITDAGTYASVRAERALLADLRAGCHAPLGVESQVSETGLTLEAVVLSPDGKQRIKSRVAGTLAEPEQIGRELAKALRQLGAEALIESAR